MAPNTEMCRPEGRGDEDCSLQQLSSRELFLSDGARRIPRRWSTCGGSRDYWNTGDSMNPAFFRMTSDDTAECAVTTAAVAVGVHQQYAETSASIGHATSNFSRVGSASSLGVMARQLRVRQWCESDCGKHAANNIEGCHVEDQQHCRSSFPRNVSSFSLPAATEHCGSSLSAAGGYGVSSFSLPAAAEDCGSSLSAADGYGGGCTNGLPTIGSPFGALSHFRKKVSAQGQRASPISPPKGQCSPGRMTSPSSLLDIASLGLQPDSHGQKKLISGFSYPPSDEASVPSEMARHRSHERPVPGHSNSKTATPGHNTASWIGFDTCSPLVMPSHAGDMGPPLLKSPLLGAANSPVCSVSLGAGGCPHSPLMQSSHSTRAIEWLGHKELWQALEISLINAKVISSGQLRKNSRRVASAMEWTSLSGVVFTSIPVDALLTKPSFLLILFAYGVFMGFHAIFTVVDIANKGAFPISQFRLTVLATRGQCRSFRPPKIGFALSGKRLPRAGFTSEWSTDKMGRHVAHVNFPDEVLINSWLMTTQKSSNPACDPVEISAEKSAGKCSDGTCSTLWQELRVMGWLDDITSGDMLRLNITEVSLSRGEEVFFDLSPPLSKHCELLGDFSEAFLVTAAVLIVFFMGEGDSSGIARACLAMSIGNWSILTIVFQPWSLDRSATSVSLALIPWSVTNVAMITVYQRYCCVLAPLLALYILLLDMFVFSKTFPSVGTTRSVVTVTFWAYVHLIRSLDKRRAKSIIAGDQAQYDRQWRLLLNDTDSCSSLVQLERLAQRIARHCQGRIVCQMAPSADAMIEDYHVGLAEIQECKARDRALNSSCDLDGMIRCSSSGNMTVSSGTRQRQDLVVDESRPFNSPIFCFEAANSPINSPRRLPSSESAISASSELPGQDFSSSAAPAMKMREVIHWRKSDSSCSTSSSAKMQDTGSFLVRGAETSQYDEAALICSAPTKRKAAVKPALRPWDSYKREMTSEVGSIACMNKVMSIDQLYVQAPFVDFLLRRKIHIWGAQYNGYYRSRRGGFEKWRIETASLDGVLWCGVKHVDRSVEKLLRVYHGDVSLLVDVCRQCLVFDSITDLHGCLLGINNDPDVDIVRIKNRLSRSYDSSQTAGYRDVSLNISMTLPHLSRVIDTHICEVQLVLKGTAELKSGEGHARYIHFRNIRGE